MYLLDRIVRLLPKKAQPFAKAIVPALAGVIVTGAQWAVTGDLDIEELKVGIGAVGAAALTFLMPNRQPAVTDGAASKP